MKKGLINELFLKFEQVKQIQNNLEFWSARDMQEILGYAQWKNFEKVIDKAKTACLNAGVEIGSGVSREIQDVALTRYACYLIAQNDDASKAQIAFSQTYFAVQTRKQEIIEQRLIDLARVSTREKLSRSERKLSGILFERGVDDKVFAIIHSKGRLN
ncbi:MAG: damage-inducible protein D [Bacteroidetes bacterium]|nr:damage-inducible protein D [Bacteroidota bacterium]